MKQNWKLYVSLFKDLIADGWIVVRDGTTTIYWWLDPYCKEPRKLKFKAAAHYLLNKEAL